MIATKYKIPLNQIRKLGDLYGIHKAVYNLFPSNNRSFIFANLGIIDKFVEILIISTNSPIAPDFGEIITKQIPKKFLNKKRYRFKTIINPVNKTSERKNPVPIINAEELSKWFLYKSNLWGFSPNPINLDVSNIHVEQCMKGKTKYTFNSATFSGILSVTNQEKFIQSFKTGLGRGKAFGFGLLQLRPLI